MQIWAETGKSALPIRNYSHILYQFLMFTQNLKRSLLLTIISVFLRKAITTNTFIQYIINRMLHTMHREMMTKYTNLVMIGT